jgi:hypothetical protein
MAALFALATVGLSIWVAVLQREVAGMRSAPGASAAVAEVLFGERDRGVSAVEVAPETPYIVLLAILGGDVPEHDRYQLRVTDRRGVLVFASDPLAGGTYAEHWLVLRRSELPDGDLHLALYGLEEGREELLEERVLTLEAPAAGSP